MREVAIIGVGQVPVAEHWSSSLRQLASDAISATLEDAQGIYQIMVEKGLWRNLQ